MWVGGWLGQETYPESPKVISFIATALPTPASSAKTMKAVPEARPSFPWGSSTEVILPAVLKNSRTCRGRWMGGWMGE